MPVLLMLFVGSGCAALIYEIVWLQLLQLVVGSSAVSMAVLLGTFMGGMCLGSLALPRLMPRTWHPLRTYAALELGIAIAGLGVLFMVPAIGQLYTALVGHGLRGILLRAAVCSVCLLPPTMLMGATLPAIARWLETTPRGIARLGFFYGGNTAGAVLGCLLAGFYLLRVHDGAIATYCAVTLNLAVALIAWLMARGTVAPADPTLRGTTNARAARDGVVLVAIAVSGLCALAAEVIWARVLSLLLGATVYTFSIILAVFLVGLGLGSTAGAAIGRSTKRPRLAFACCQLLQVLAIAWAAHAVSRDLLYWTGDGSVSLVAKFRFDLLRCGAAILPSSLLWGASFPLALAAMNARGADAAHLVGRVYAANTLGAIAGAVLASMIFIPSFGTQHTHALLMGLSALAAILLLAPRTTRDFGFVAIGVAMTLLAANLLPALPWQLVAYGRQVATTHYAARPLYLGEGMHATVAVSESPDGARFFHVSGKTEASSLNKDMRLQRMLGHIPALLHPNPRSVLIVGCGAGVTAGTFVLHPSIERIVICDIEPLIPAVVAEFFRHENHGVIHDPRVEIVHDDARHYIATTREKFDLITSDPIHPWVKGSAVLYSHEYFQLCRARLNPGGLVTQWVPLYEADRAVVQSEIATFFSVFPHGTVWANDDDGFGYDTVMLGQAEPLRIDVDALQNRLERPDHQNVQRALATLGLGSAADLISTYAAREADLRSWLAPAEINRDRSLRLQYLAGLQLESDHGAHAYREIVALRTFPAELLHGSAETLHELRAAFGRGTLFTP